MEVSIGRSVNESQPILLPLGDCHLHILSAFASVYHLAVDQDVVRKWRAPGRLHGKGIEFESGLVVPICERYGPKIDIVVCGCRAIDDQCPHDAIAILRRVMAVIVIIQQNFDGIDQENLPVVPRRTELSAQELVRLGFARSDRTCTGC